MPEHLRHPNYRAFEFTVDITAGKVVGLLYLISGTVCTPYEAKAITEVVVMIYHAEKILVDKNVVSTDVFVVGQKVYFDATTGKATATAGANLWIGICIEAATAVATQVLIDLKGDKAT